MANINLGGLSLMDGEEDWLSFQAKGPVKETNDFRLCLVGRFLADRPIR